jgi:hypothetical protein
VPGIFPGVRGGRCVGLTTLSSSWADCLEIWQPQSPGTLWGWQRLYKDFFTFTYFKPKPGIEFKFKGIHPVV